MLEQPDILDTLIRAGVSHGAWCLFRMGAAESGKPAAFHARENGELPLQLDLTEPGWSLVTPPGAKQRHWTATDKPDSVQIRQWVQAATHSP